MCKKVLREWPSCTVRICPRRFTEVEPWDLLSQIPKEWKLKDYSEVVGLKKNNKNSALNKE